MSEDRADWTLPLDLASLAGAEAALDEFFASAGVDGTPAFVLKTVFEELGRNLVEHAGGTADDDLTVTAIAGTDLVTLVMEDSRPPFDPIGAAELDTAAPLEDRRAGGIGLHLVREMTETLRYERRGERNRVTATVARG